MLELLNLNPDFILSVVAKQLIISCWILYFGHIVYMFYLQKIKFKVNCILYKILRWSNNIQTQDSLDDVNRI